MASREECMSTNYDTIAEEYKRAKLQPWRLHIEAFTLAELVGDLSGKSVLDLACGEGFHTRALKQKGAGRIVGVDVSAGMIDLARQEEARRPLGIEYVVADVKGLELHETFDLVFAAYLLNYASTREELLAMCRAIARHLKPGCKFVTINSNPDGTGATDAMRPYGFTREDSPKVEGTPITWTFFLDGESFSIINYHLSRGIHEWALTTAGLGDIRWHAPRVSPEGLRQYGQAYWADFLQHKPAICLECRKTG
jgi:ubiquinone/menaquinone biosynthesis C-methylase UbiE